MIPSRGDGVDPHLRLLWADEYPEALQELVDPTITLAGGTNDVPQGWGLPAGWVPIVNRLHGDLVELLGDYEVVRVGNKMSALRFAMDRHRRDDGGPDVWEDVNDLLQAASAESLSTCDLCGGSANGKLSFGITRCTGHQLTRATSSPVNAVGPVRWPVLRGGSRAALTPEEVPGAPRSLNRRRP